jgi:cytochrome c peroxidase
VQSAHQLEERTVRRTAPVAALAAVAALWLTGCSDDTTAPRAEPTAPVAFAVTPEMVAQVRQLAAAQGITAVPRPAAVRPELMRLGQALAFDKELSGNRDISCMSCHLAGAATVDQRSLAIGQGATGLGLARVHPQGTFVHRSAPALFNLHAMTMLTWDGRVFLNANNKVQTPQVSLLASERAALEFGPLSALPMFPVLSRPEMRGTSGNELAAIADSDPRKTWRFLMRRLGAIPTYRTMFEAAYPGQQFDNMNFAHAGNAMGAWIAGAFPATNSPWDRFLAGQDAALTEQQLRGAQAFLGVAKCSQCHNGPLLSDNKFHNVLVPQVGPGFGDGADGHDDFGRMRVSKNVKNKYQYRTPPLRNVELTAPYGHDGALTTLRGWVDHYSQADAKLRAYNPGQLEPLLQTTLQPTVADILLTRDFRINKLTLAPDMVDDITEFLKALTDPGARDLSRFVPDSVPSGLPVDRLP